MRKLLAVLGLIFALPAAAVVTSTANAVTYACDNSTTAFAISFPFIAGADLIVTRTSSTGAVTTLVLTTDYSVSGGAFATGTLTTTGSPCAAGNTLTIARSGMGYTQPTSFRNQGTFSPRVHENAFDRMTMLLQNLYTKEVADMGTAAAAINTVTASAAAVGSLTSVQATNSPTPRTLGDRAADTVNVKDFGCKGDGSTNDYACLILAENALVARGGGTMYFPVSSGCYMTKFAIPLVSNIRLLGEQRSVCIKATNDSIDNLVGIGQQYGYWLRDALNNGVPNWWNIAWLIAADYNTALTPQQAYVSGSWAGRGIYNFGVENLTFDGNMSNRPVSKFFEIQGNVTGAYSVHSYWKPGETVVGQTSGASGVPTMYHDLGITCGTGAECFGFRVDPVTWNGIAWTPGETVRGSQSGTTQTYVQTAEDDSVGLGINFEECTKCFIRNCTLHDLPHEPINFYGNSVFGEVTGNLLYNNIGNSAVNYTRQLLLSDSGGSFALIADNTFILRDNDVAAGHDVPGPAILWQSTSDNASSVKILRNKILNTYSSGIVFGGAGTGKTVDGLEIRDNYISGAACAAAGGGLCDTTPVGIDIRQARSGGTLLGTTVSGNTIVAMAHGIIGGPTAGTSTGLTAQGNTVLSCGSGRGITITAGATKSTISNNVVKGTCGVADYFFASDAGSSYGPNSSDAGTAPVNTFGGSLSAPSVLAGTAIISSQVSSGGANQMILDFSNAPAGRMLIDGPSAGVRAAFSVLQCDSALANCVTGFTSDTNGNSTVGALSIGSGTFITKTLRAGATLGTSAIAAGTTATQTITVTGAAAGADCIVGPPATLETGLTETCVVSASNTVLLRTANVTAASITPAGSQTVNVRVFNP